MLAEEKAAQPTPKSGAPARHKPGASRRRQAAPGKAARGGAVHDSDLLRVVGAGWNIPVLPVSIGSARVPTLRIIPDRCLPSEAPARWPPRRRRSPPRCRRSPPARPPTAACRPAGPGRRARSGRGGRSASTRVPSSAPNSTAPSPTRSTLPSSRLRSMTMRMRSPSRTLPIGPPASASGPTWPMHAPVETPEKRASVSTATCLPKLQVLQRRGDLIDLLHARSHRAAADQHQHVARLDAIGAVALDRRDGRASRVVKTRAGPDLAIDAVGIDHATDRWPCS